MGKLSPVMPSEVWVEIAFIFPISTAALGMDK